MTSTQTYIPRKMLLQWHLTERCNLHCTHCYQDHSRPPDLSFDQLLSILGQFDEALEYWRRKGPPQFQRAHVTVTGGEPFVRADFIDLLRLLAKRRDRLSFAVLTNGTFIDKPTARELKRLGVDFVQVSMEGTPPTHDAIRGCGNHARTVAALGYLRAAGVRTLVSFTAHRGNFREFPAVAALCRKLRVSRLWTDRFIPISEHSSASSQMLSKEETKELIECIYHARRTFCLPWRRRTEIAAHRALQFLGGDGVPYRCSAGKSLLTVQANGDLVPCRRMPTVVGNLMQTPLLELYESSPLLQALREEDFVPNACRRCAHANSCAGGLRCLSYAVHGNLLHPDPGCWLCSE